MVNIFSASAAQTDEPMEEPHDLFRVRRIKIYRNPVERLSVLGERPRS
jgi:hypothetical protein